MACIAKVSRADLTFCVVSFHEQVLGCNQYIAQAKTSVDIVRGYQMFDRVLTAFAAAQVLGFDQSASVVCDGLAAQRVPHRHHGFAHRVHRVEPGIDVADTQLTRFQQSSRPSHRGLDYLTRDRGTEKRGRDYSMGAASLFSTRRRGCTMMQRLFLIPDSEGTKTFDGPRLRKAIQSLVGVTCWQESDLVDPADTLFLCQLPTGDDKIWPIPVEVRKNLSSVSIGSYHERGLNAALDIQRHYGGEIFAFSEELSPEVLPLSSIKSPHELAEKLKLR